MINEISLAGNVMLTFIDHRLHILEQVHDQFMGGFNVIMTCNFYQVHLVWNLWILNKKPMNSIF